MLLSELKSLIRNEIQSALQEAGRKPGDVWKIKTDLGHLRVKDLESENLLVKIVPESTPNLTLSMENKVRIRG